MTYPAIVMFVALVIVLGLCTFIVPSFFKLFKDLGLKDENFPVMTLMLKNFSDFLIAGFPVRQVVIAIVVFLLIVAAHIARLISEGVHLLLQPTFAFTSVLSIGLSAWAWRLFREL